MIDKCAALVRFGMRRVASCRVASPKTTSKSISTAAAAAATAASAEAVDVCKCCWCLCFFFFWEPLQHHTKQRLATAALHASLPANAPVVIVILVVVVAVFVHSLVGAPIYISIEFI